MTTLAHPKITRICFNGATAETCFRRHLAPATFSGRALELIRLPSTSPAHARMTFTAKLAAWHAALGQVGKSVRD